MTPLEHVVEELRVLYLVPSQLKLHVAPSTAFLAVTAAPQAPMVTPVVVVMRSEFAATAHSFPRHEYATERMPLVHETAPAPPVFIVYPVAHFPTQLAPSLRVPVHVPAAYFPPMV
jgi:hypothetical protein